MYNISKILGSYSTKVRFSRKKKTKQQTNKQNKTKTTTKNSCLVKNLCLIPMVPYHCKNRVLVPYLRHVLAIDMSSTT